MKLLYIVKVTFFYSNLFVTSPFNFVLDLCSLL